MAETRAVWGIDIGQAGLKAVKLRYADAAEQVIAVGFDYVPHPKILSQPDAIPEELIPQALERFLSRNDVKGDVVAISVPGQTALARFIQLPPVESAKVAEIVKYEARQQIPFALEDVIWDYQALGGGVEESGFMLEAEVGLFAMKRDQVMQQLQPFTDSKVEVDLIQIAPLALYNFLSYDRLGIRPGEEVGALDEYVILIDMGADNTTLLVTNGQKIWIRNVPIGGNHFTRALTKEMKLTFAKAEHLKCNATKSPDPRAVFQALRPVFNDYVSEIQRSIGYFSSVNRDAKVSRILGLGNGFKLAGLQKFLQQNLQYDVERVETFQSLVGDRVLKASLFQENILSFGVPYGLALQGLGLTRIHTTLLPPEIAMTRKIRQKKPWAVAAAAGLLVGLSLSAVGYSKVFNSVSEQRFGKAESKVDELKSTVSKFQSNYEQAKGQNQSLVDQEAQLTQTLKSRELWLEIYKAINECLPRDVGNQQDIDDIAKQNRIKLTLIRADRTPDFTPWFSALPPMAKRRMNKADQAKPPEKPGYLFTLQGVHYHHDEEKREMGFLFIRDTLLKNLQSWEVQHPGSPPFPVRKLGISHATVISDSTQTLRYNPKARKQSRRLAGGPFGSQGFMGPTAPGYSGYDMTGEAETNNVYGATSKGYNLTGVLPGPLPGAPGSPGTPGTLGTGRYPGVGGGQLSGLRQELERGKELESIREVQQTSFTLQLVWIPTPPEERPQTPPAEGEGTAADSADAGQPQGSP